MIHVTGYCNKGLDLLGEMNSDNTGFSILKRDGCPVGHKGDDPEARERPLQRFPGQYRVSRLDEALCRQGDFRE